MKWLTLPQIKQHLRIEPDFTLEDDVLTAYGASAEDTVLNVLNRDYTEVIERWGEVPAPIVHASLLLVSLSYQIHEPATDRNMYMVPYAFDIMVKPYMKLANDNYGQNNNNRYGKHCNL